MSLTDTDSFHLSTGMNPRTQNKDSLEDSVSTSPDPSKRGLLTGEGGREVGAWGWMVKEALGEQEGALWEENGLEVHMSLGGEGRGETLQPLRWNMSGREAKWPVLECDSGPHRKGSGIPRAGLGSQMLNDGSGEKSEGIRPETVYIPVVGSVCLGCICFDHPCLLK